jgi:2-dehydro-3-deoxy-D-arabinonate dehydratase
VTDALFRVALTTGPRLARGTTEAGPRELLPEGLRLDDLLAVDGPGLASAFGFDSPERCPAQAPWLAPLEGQEVWCSGVTYARTREARAVTAAEPSIYDDLFVAERPELFFKAPGWRVRGPGEAVAIRTDSGWDMAEPELGLVIAADGSIAGYVIGNDMTSRAIERDNPLYLPQAKVYDGSCALGPAITPTGAAVPPFPIRMRITRRGAVVFDGEVSTAQMVRRFEDLAAWLFRALTFPRGVVLLTGCGIVPDASLTLQPGDSVRIEMGALGVLENPIVLVPRPSQAAC